MIHGALWQPVTSKRLEISLSFMYSLCLPLSTISVFIHALIMSKQRICLLKNQKPWRWNKLFRFVESMRCGLASRPAVGQPDIKKKTHREERTDKQANRLSWVFPLHVCRPGGLQWIVMMMTNIQRNFFQEAALELRKSRRKEPNYQSFDSATWSDSMARHKANR